MLTGPFQNLGSSEGWNPCAGEPWLLPISDSDAVPADTATDAIAIAVRRASRPLFIAANALCVALGLLIAVESATGWMSHGPAAPVAKAPVVASAS
ncbi:hypothetical protein [Methylobacterium nigriterrae]|uniref:hypothetical protein n=1 Tax=Methylobacterium nigriterrae TaxID=3127512 RepID=UPI0030137C86